MKSPVIRHNTKQSRYKEVHEFYIETINKREKLHTLLRSLGAYLS